VEAFRIVRLHSAAAEECIRAMATGDAIGDEDEVCYPRLPCFIVSIHFTYTL